MKNVFIHSNGCAVLLHETERVAKYFSLNGWAIVKHPEQAQVLVMTCCGVTQREEDEAIMMIKDLEAKRIRNSRFIISGCMPAFARDRVLYTAPQAVVLKYEELPMLDTIISATVSFTSVYYNAKPILNQSIEAKETIDDDLCLMRKIDDRYHTHQCEQAWEFSTMRKYMWQDDRTFQIKVSYGCPGNCSYCATKLGIGNFRSVDREAVMLQFREGLAQGYKRFLLIGDEIGAYGRDIGSSLPDLLQEMYDVSQGQVTIAIRYIHPDIFVAIYERLKPFFALGFVTYFCCAIQSGSADVLKRMNRNPRIEPFLQCMEDLNAQSYKVNKHTQIIIGFPGETAEDFLWTMDALRRCKFDHININLYSPRKHTVAWNMQNDVTEEQKMFRAQIIRDIMKLHKKTLLYETIKHIELL